MCNHFVLTVFKPFLKVEHALWSSSLLYLIWNIQMSRPTESDISQIVGECLSLFFQSRTHQHTPTHCSDIISWTISCWSAWDIQMCLISNVDRSIATSIFHNHTPQPSSLNPFDLQLPLRFREIFSKIFYRSLLSRYTDSSEAHRLILPLPASLEMA